MKIDVSLLSYSSVDHQEGHPSTCPVRIKKQLANPDLPAGGH